MTNWGKVDYSELKAFTKRLERLAKIDYDTFMRDCAKELAARLLAKAIKRTPVGQYPASSGKMGGTLRRGWTAKTEAEAQSGGNKNAAAYAKSLPVARNGDTYTVEIINPVRYGIYVEYGHRTSNHKGWVAGQFMLTMSVAELQAEAPRILEKKLEKMLKELFNGK